MEVTFSFDAPLTKPLNDASVKINPPSQTPDGEEYICGDSGPGFPGNNPGRDQDRSRLDEAIPAQGCSRYIP